MPSKQHKKLKKARVIDPSEVIDDLSAYKENRAVEVEKPGEFAVSSFFDADTVELALQENNFSAAEYLREQIQLTKDPDPKIKQRALTEMRRHLKDIEDKRSVKATETRETTEEDGTKITREVTTRAVLANLQETNRHADDNLHENLTRTQEPT